MGIEVASQYGGSECSFMSVILAIEGEVDFASDCIISYIMLTRVGKNRSIRQRHV